MRAAKLNYQGVLSFLTEEEVFNKQHEAQQALAKLLNKTGLGNEYLGWIDYPSKVSEEELDNIIEVSKKIVEQSDVLVVIGIGGSYLGAKAALDLLRDYSQPNKSIEVVFLGHNISSTYTYEILEYLKDKDFSVNVISKSGTTTEPAIAFRLIRQLLEEKYGNKARERIIVTTDKEKGALRRLSKEKGYLTFILPSDIGGRFSVLTSVGLIPMAVCGIDIKQVIEGAKLAQNYLLNASFNDNDSLLYAVIRTILHQKYHKDIEVLASFEPNFRYFTEWWKQLFGESEGKNHLGLFPASVIYSTDLHSIGQYLQDGKRHLIETIVSFEKSKYDLEIPVDGDNLDELNYLTNYKLSEINKIAQTATMLAHIDGGIPLLEIKVKEMNELSFGYLVYFFMLAVGVSGYLLGVNPFDQEGVEDYKRNMFALLNKDGYQDLRESLVKRLNEKNS